MDVFPGDCGENQTSHDDNCPNLSVRRSMAMLQAEFSEYSPQGQIAAPGLRAQRTDPPRALAQRVPVAAEGQSTGQGLPPASLGGGPASALDAPSSIIPTTARVAGSTNTISSLITT
jgi:hypothetical protein